MSRYAEATTVDAPRSRAEIERILERYGATGFMYGWQRDTAIVAFEAKGRRIRFTIPLPDRHDRAFTHTPTGLRRTAKSEQEAFEQATRQRWRALALVIKAKLEAVESGISEFQEEFMAFIVLPDGQTVGEWMGPQIAETYRTGQMPPLLPGASTPLLLPPPDGQP